MLLLERVHDFIATHGLIRTGDRVLLAVSGGPDSLCLLHLLHTLAPRLGITLAVAHLDHGLRPEAGEEAAFVQAQAAGLSLPCHLGWADTRAEAAARRHSLEEAARNVRYAFLAQTAREVGAACVAVAHTADDQAETVLMHFLRGSGLAGLKGMRPLSPLPPIDQPAADDASSLQPPTSSLCLIRPLLAATRAEVEAYCLAHGLAPRRDPTNADPRFLRNRLRHELLPLLEQYNPQVRAVLARTARVLAGEYDLVQAHLAGVWEQVSPPALQVEGQVVFDRARWLSLSVPEQRALLRAAVQRLRHASPLRDVDFTPVEAAVKFCRHAVPGQGCDLLAGLRLAVERETVVVVPWGVETVAATAQAGPLLSAEGQLEAPWQFSVEPLEPPAWAPGEPVPAPDTAWEVYVDADRAQPLCLRARRPGDRFQPMGLGGHTTKLSNFMINQKVPPSLRPRWPLVVSGAHIVWVAGLRLDERYKVRPDTERVTRLRFYRSTA